MASNAKTMTFKARLRVAGITLALTAPVWLTLLLAVTLDQVRAAPRAAVLAFVAIACAANGVRVATNLTR